MSGSIYEKVGIEQQGYQSSCQIAFSATPYDCYQQRHANECLWDRCDGEYHESVLSGEADGREIMTIKPSITSIPKLMDEREAGMRRLGAAFRPEAASEETPDRERTIKSMFISQESLCAFPRSPKRPFCLATYQ